MRSATYDALTQPLQVNPRSLNGIDGSRLLTPPRKLWTVETRRVARLSVYHHPSLSADYRSASVTTSSLSMSASIPEKGYEGISRHQCIHALPCTAAAWSPRSSVYIRFSVETLYRTALSMSMTDHAPRGEEPGQIVPFPSEDVFCPGARDFTVDTRRDTLLFFDVRMNLTRGPGQAPVSPLAWKLDISMPTATHDFSPSALRTDIRLLVSSRLVFPSDATYAHGLCYTQGRFIHPYMLTPLVLSSACSRFAQCCTVPSRTRNTLSTKRGCARGMGRRV